MQSDEGWAYWFTGLVDGEGCFRIAFRLERRSYRPAFAVVLRDDDANIILEILEHFKFGIVRKRSFSAPSKGGIGFHVDAKTDLLKLVKFFDQYPLRSKKANDYVVWREAVMEYQKPQVVRNQAKLKYLYSKLKMVRQYEASEAEDFEPIEFQLEFWQELSDNNVESYEGLKGSLVVGGQ